MKRAPAIPRAGREIVLEAHKLSNAEARLVVASYYDAQEMRKRADMQIRHLGDKEMPKILQYTADANAIIENEVKKALLRYSEATAVGQWCLSHVGIGPVITAGLLAHLDITKAPTAGHFWSFAGLNPAQKWERGEKRPYNAALKQVCFHAGESYAQSEPAVVKVPKKMSEPPHHGAAFRLSEFDFCGRALSRRYERKILKTDD